MWKEFKEFAMKGSVIDLAIGVIIGAAFGKVVSSLAADVLMPPLGLLTKGVDFSSLFVALNGKSYPSLAAAKTAGAPTINYGVFLNNLLDFFLVAFAVFLVIKQVNRFRHKREAAPGPTTEERLLGEIRDLLRDRRQSV